MLLRFSGTLPSTSEDGTSSSSPSAATPSVEATLTLSGKGMAALGLATARTCTVDADGRYIFQVEIPSGRALDAELATALANATASVEFVSSFEEALPVEAGDADAAAEGGEEDVAAAAPATRIVSTALGAIALELQPLLSGEAAVSGEATLVPPAEVVDTEVEETAETAPAVVARTAALEIIADASLTSYAVAGRLLIVSSVGVETQDRAGSALRALLAAEGVAEGARSAGDTDAGDGAGLSVNWNFGVDLLWGSDRMASGDGAEVQAPDASIVVCEVDVTSAPAPSAGDVAAEHAHVTRRALLETQGAAWSGEATSTTISFGAPTAAAAAAASPAAGDEGESSAGDANDTSAATDASTTESTVVPTSWKIAASADTTTRVVFLDASLIARLLTTDALAELNISCVLCNAASVAVEGADAVAAEDQADVAAGVPSAVSTAVRTWGVAQLRGLLEPGALGVSVSTTLALDVALAADESLPLAGANVRFNVALSAPLIEHLGSSPPLILGDASLGALGVAQLLAEARAAATPATRPSSAVGASPQGASKTPLLSDTPSNSTASPLASMATQVGSGLRAIRAARVEQDAAKAAAYVDPTASLLKLRAAIQDEAQTIVAAVAQEYELATKSEALLFTAQVARHEELNTLAADTGRAISPSAREGLDPTLEERARRRALLVMHALNSSGAYFALKESLKRAVSAYVRKVWTLEEAATLGHDFVAKLYADILGEAFTALNSAYSKERAIKRASSLGLPAPTDVVPLSAAKFATAIITELDAVGDAEMTGDVVKAAALLSACISKVEARASTGEGEVDLYGTPLPTPAVLLSATVGAHLARARFAFARIDNDPAMHSKVGSSLVAALTSMEESVGGAAVATTIAALVERVDALTAWGIYLVSTSEWGKAEAVLVEAHRVTNVQRVKHDQEDHRVLLKRGPALAALIAVVCQLAGRPPAFTATWLSPPLILGDPTENRSGEDVIDSLSVLAHVRTRALLDAATIVVERKCLAGLETVAEIALAMSEKTMEQLTVPGCDPVGIAKDLMLERLVVSARLGMIRAAQLRSSKTEREDEALIELTASLKLLREATALNAWDSNAWIALGDALGEWLTLQEGAIDSIDLNGDGVNSSVASERIACYEYASQSLTKRKEQVPVATVFQLAQLYAANGDQLRAKAKFLQCVECTNGKYASAYLGLGIAARKLGLTNEAEDALAEANMLDVSNADVWAQLALLALGTGSNGVRADLARSCVSEAMHHGLHDAAVLGELGTAFAAQCDFATADQMLRASLALKDSPSLRLSFASVLRSLNRQTEALTHLTHVTATQPSGVLRTKALIDAAATKRILGVEIEEEEMHG